MSGSDSDAERFPHLHQVSSTRSQEGNGRAHKRASKMRKDFWLDQFTTPEEREFGWSSSLSGIRGLTEQQLMRIMYFERSLKLRLEMDSSDTPEYPREGVRASTCSSQLRNLPPDRTGSEYNTYGLSCTLATDASCPCSNAVNAPIRHSSRTLKTRQSAPEFGRLVSSKLNHSLRTTRSQSSFLLLKILKRRTSSQSNWSSESDELSYLLARREISDSDTEPHFRLLDNTANAKRTCTEKGLRGLMNRISRALTSPHITSNAKKGDFQDIGHENCSESLYHLSHDMVGAASPFPMRPPLNLGSRAYSTTVDGDWVGINRRILLEPSG